MAPERLVIGVDIGGTKVAAALVRGRLPGPDARYVRRGGDAGARGPVHHAHRRELSRGHACAASRPVSPTSSTARGAWRASASAWPPWSTSPPGASSSPSICRSPTCRSATSCGAGSRCRWWWTTTPRRPAIGEWVYGAGAGARDMIMLTLGTGVGGGIISGGRPLRGASGAAGELGHIIVEFDGLKCPANCPNWGCLEAYAAGPAMGAAARVAAELEPDSELGRALAAGRTVDSRLLTRLALDGRRGLHRGARARRGVPGRRARHAEQHLRPGAVRHRRRRGGGGRPAPGAGPPRPRRPRSPAGARPRARRAGGARSRRRASSARRRSRSPSSSRRTCEA